MFSSSKIRFFVKIITTYRGIFSLFAFFLADLSYFVQNKIRHNDSAMSNNKNVCAGIVSIAFQKAIKEFYFYVLFRYHQQQQNY